MHQKSTTGCRAIDDGGKKPDLGHSDRHHGDSHFSASPSPWSNVDLQPQLLEDTGKIGFSLASPATRARYHTIISITATHNRTEFCNRRPCMYCGHHVCQSPSLCITKILAKIAEDRIGPVCSVSCGGTLRQGPSSGSQQLDESKLQRDATWFFRQTGQ